MKEYLRVFTKQCSVRHWETDFFSRNW